jgi:hypothetical protein
MKNKEEVKRINGEIESLEKRIAALVAKAAHPKLIAEREAELKALYMRLEALELGDDGVDVDVDDPTPTPTKKAQGRPKGSKNRPKAGVNITPKVSLPDDKPEKKTAVPIKGTYVFRATGKVAKSGLSKEFSPIDGSPFAGLGALYVKLGSLPEDCEGFTVFIS